MYKHVVLWKLIDDVDGMSRSELAAEVKQRLETLPGVISEIEGYEVGVNIGAYGASFFDVSLISTFPDEEAFKRYCVYPEHDAAVAYIQSVTEAEEIVDYLI
jgi:hypothetical protein